MSKSFFIGLILAIMDVMTSYLQFTGTELISDILEKMPEAGDILTAHGIHCVGCHVNVYETLEQGVLGHGMTQEDLDRVLADINDASQELGIPINGYVKKNPELTEYAKEKVIEFQKAQEKTGFGFKIDVLETDGELSYFLDFLETPEKGDRIIESLGINLFLSPESLKLLMDCAIDFVETEEGAGFKIEKK